jgi:hypothetical protein
VDSNGFDVLGPDDAADHQFAQFEIDANFLAALDHHIAVRQHLRTTAATLVRTSSERLTEPLPSAVDVESVRPLCRGWAPS